MRVSSTAFAGTLAWQNRSVISKPLFGNAAATVAIAIPLNRDLMEAALARLGDAERVNSRLSTVLPQNQYGGLARQPVKVTKGKSTPPKEYILNHWSRVGESRTPKTLHTFYIREDGRGGYEVYRALGPGGSPVSIAAQMKTIEQLLIDIISS